MSHLVTVYDSKGEPFEVGHELAADLVLNKGWSRTAPSLTPEPAPAPAPAESESSEADLEYSRMRTLAQRGG